MISGERATSLLSLKLLDKSRAIPESLYRAAGALSHFEAYPKTMTEPLVASLDDTTS